MLLCLLFVFFQDWKYRHIHVALPIAIFSLSFYITQQQSNIVLKIMSYNIIFFLITLSVLTIYMSIKNKKILNPFQNYFGLGDLLFYIAITPLFLLQKYVLFFILSMVFAVLMQLGLKRIIKQETVPLAGFSALLLIMVILKDTFLNFQKMTIL
ncbi:prepilin peptidase [Flavobacterium sp.]|uniref:prepilin peptidase n=1 Tax=Flavobacterium sp. TaxID=239 RepID=UPI0038FD244F